MGGAQSAQLEDKDPAAEESGGAEDAQPGQHAEDKSPKNNGQISEIGGKADATVAGIKGHSEEEVGAEAIVSPDKDVSVAEKPLEEINEHESPNEADANEEVTLETIEMDAKHNDINESFRRIFSNINLKVTVKRGSAEKDDAVADVSGDATKEETTEPEGPAETEKDDTSKNADMNMALNTEQEPHDSTCPTLTAIKSEDLEEEKTTETTGEASGEDAGPTEPAGDDESAQQTATSDGEMVVSPVKRFFKTGIFSGLRKKKKSVDETAEKELVDMRKAEVVEPTDDKEVGPSVETEAVETQRKENGLKDEVSSPAPALTADEGKSPSTDPSAIIGNEPEMVSSQEKEKVQASPLKRLLSGSSFKKPSKKQRERRSSEAKLSDSGEYVSNQLPPSADAAESPKGDSPAGEEDGAWASFKKLMTPKKRVKRSSLTNEETQTSGLVQESKSSEGEPMSDNSTEEIKKRKDSSVSWEAVLCGSGRRRSRSRSRKTSDSEDEKPQEESDTRKKESPLESSNEIDTSPTAHSKHEGSGSEGDGGSTWRSIKKLVTPKRKAKDEDLQSDGEAAQEDSSFSIKKLLPGQKRRKPAEKQDYVSSDEAEKEVASCDEDSETPAVVPLSEFDEVDAGVHLETHADVESHTSVDADCKRQEDDDKTTEPGESLQGEAKPGQDNEDALEDEAPTAPALEEEPDESAELISKHQQLSDIPEEGVITETMVTPGSAPEQPARDDTIAEDLIEITSEAITAPEPVDVTMADDTEMISAVSQLSDSSRTSGNTTPVPVEYDVEDTEVLLQQVAENITASPTADPLCSDEVRSQRIVASVSCQVLEGFVKQQPTILEIHRGSDATAFKTGLNVKLLDDVKEHAATAQTESVAEVSEVVHTEIVSEVPTKLDAAESAVDDVHEVRVTQTEESIELEGARANKSRDLMKHQAEYEAATENLSEGEETVQCSTVEAHRAETETLQAQCADGAVTQEVQTLLEAQTLVEAQDEILEKLTVQLQAEVQDGAVTQEVQTLFETQTLVEAQDEILEKLTVQLQAELQDGAVTQEVQTLFETQTLVEAQDEILEKLTVQLQAEVQDQSCVEVVQEVQELAAAERDTRDSQEDGAEEVPAVEGVTVQLTDAELEKEDGVQEDKAPAALDSDISGIQICEKPVASPAAETVIDEPELFPEVPVQPEKEDKLQTDASNTEHDQVSAAHEAALDTETLGTEEQTSHSIQTEEDVPDQCKEPEPLTDTDAESEKKEQADSSKTDDGQEPEVHNVQDPVADPQIRRTEIMKEELLSVETKAELEVTDEPKGQPESLLELNANVEMRNEVQAECEHGAAPEALDGQTNFKDSEKSQEVSEDTPPAETVTDEQEEQPESLMHGNVELEREDGPQSEILEQASLPSQTGISTTHVPEKEVTLSEDMKAEEAETDEPREEREPVSEAHVDLEKKNNRQTDAVKSDHAPDVSDVKETALVSEGSIQTPGGETLLEDVPPGETDTEEPKEEPGTEINMELERKELQADAAKPDHEQDPDVSDVKETTLVSEGSVQTAGCKVPLSEDVPPGETDTEEPSEEPGTEINIELEQKELQADAVKPKQESEIFRGEEETGIDEQIGTSQISEKEVPLSQDIKPEGRVTDDPHTKAEDVLPGETDEPKEESELITEINMEIELQTDATKHELDSETFRGEEGTEIDEQVGTIQIHEKEVPSSEDVPPGETVRESPKEEPGTEINMELEKKEVDAVKSDHEQDPDVLVKGTALVSEGSVQTAGCKVPLSEDVEPEEGGRDDSDTTASTEPEKHSKLQADDVPPGETVTGEPQEEAGTEINIELERKELQADAVKPEHEQDPDVKETALASEGSVQTPGGETLTEDTEPEEGGPDDPHTEINAEPENEYKHQAEDVPPGETVTGEPKEESEPVTEISMKLERKDLQSDAAKPEDSEDCEVLAAQAAALDSGISGIEIPENEPPLQKTPPAGTVTDQHVTAEKQEELQADAAEPESAVRDESREETEPVTEVHNEPKEKDQRHADGVNTEHELIEIVEDNTSVVESHTGRVQIPEKEAALSEKCEPDKAESRDEGDPVTQVQLQASEIEEHTSAPASHVGSAQLAPASEDFKPEEAVTDELREESESAPEIYIEPEKENELHEVQEAASEMGNIQTPESESSGDVQPTEAVSEDTTEHVPLVEDNQRTLALVPTSRSEATAESQRPTDKPRNQTEPLTGVNVGAQVAQVVLQEGRVESEDTSGAVTAEPTQATEGDTEPEVERPTTEPVQVLTCDVKVTETETSASECVTAQETKEDELNSAGSDDAPASATGEPEDEAGDVNQDLGRKDPTPEISPQDVQLEEERSVPEVAGKFQTLSAVHVSSVAEEKNRAHVLEKTAIPEEKPAPLDKARDTYEPKHEVHLSEVRGLVQPEHQGELPGPEIQTSAVEHAVVAQVTTCGLKEVSPAVPHVLTEEPSGVWEPAVEMVVGEQEVQEEAEKATPLARRDESEAAAGASVVVTMRVSSAQLADDHGVQVQVGHVDVTSAGTSVDSALEAGVTEAKEAVDVCHESIGVAEKLSACEETEEEPTNGERKTIRHPVTQQVKERRAEVEVDRSSGQDEAVNLEHKQAERKKSSEDDQATADSSGTVGHDEATEAMRDHKEVGEEPEDYEAGVTAEEVKCPSEGSEGRRTKQEAQNKQSLMSQTVTVSDTRLEVPQNTGLISSIGALESPSSLSLEFKLNIQFGQSKTPATERTEAAKQPSVSEVGIQAVEPINGAHENNKKPEMHDATVQATELTEPEHASPSPTERAVIMKRPVLLDIGIRSVEAAREVEQAKSAGRLNPSELESEKLKAVMQAKTFSSQLVLYEACYEEITVEEPVKQIEEENEDLWADAEEHVHTQEESHVSLAKEGEPGEPRTGSDEPEHEFEMAPETAPKAEREEGGGRQEMCEAENEAEEFAVALEHPEAAKTAPTD